MRKVSLFKKGRVVSIIILFICASFISSISGYSEETNQIDTYTINVCEPEENVLVTCSTFGFPGEPSQEIIMPLNEAEFLYNKIKDLQIEVARDPLSYKTRQLQHEIIALADKHNLLPAGLSVDTLKSHLTPTLRPQHPRIILPSLQNRASEMFCNYVSTGSGSALPIIILPRLIPILLTPIPRLFVRWKTSEGITSCGGLRSGTGFIAYGAQNGLALGFWGIGFSIFLPPVMAYGLFGYALYASVNAEEIELWPPNRAPVVSNENPPSGTWNVPVSLSELSFQIEDADGDLMSYSITTDPDIGSGSGTNKGDGVYTVSVSGLKPNTQYHWVVEVTDGKDVSMKELSFMTEELPFDPFDEGWQYRKKITIDHTQVAGALSYFPVLVSTVDSDLQVKAQDDGDDILFMEGAGVANKLYHEIEQYDGSTGELVAWMNIPSVSHDEDTVLYMYYGNPDCSSQQAPERVWSSDFVMVQHLQETLGVHYDSSSNNMDGNPIGGVSQDSSGKVDGADYFDGTNDYVDIIDSSGLEYDKMTISAWVMKDSLCSATEERIIVGKHQSGQKKGWFIEDYRNEGWGFYVGNAPIGPVRITAGEIYDTSIFYHVVGVYDNGDMELYVNGFSKASDTVVGMTHTDANVNIGRICAAHYWHGGIDEVRISKSVRGPSWILTEYYNQNDPSSFLSFGPEETGL